MPFFTLLRQFMRNPYGSLSIMVGFVFLVLVTAVGGAVDLTNAMRERVIAQRDLDAALISTFRDDEAETMTADQRAARVRGYMNETFMDFPADAVIEITQEEDTYSATLDFRSENVLLSVFGVDTFDVGVRSSVTFGPPKPMELALVLDTTSSMAYRNKMPTMQDAARDLVTTLTEFDTVRVALVPFAQHINVGIDNRNEAGLSIPADEADEEVCSSVPDMEQTNCHPEETTCNEQTCAPVTNTCTADGVDYPCEQQECRTTSSYRCTETVCDDTPTGTSSTQCTTTTGDVWRGCVGSREAPYNTRSTPPGGPVPGFLEGSCAQPILRLTTNGDSVIDAIDAFVPAGETYIAPALLWGARLISPDIPFPDGAADTGDIYKAIVLMSDGANTISKIDGEITHNGTDRATSDSVLRAACDEIKAQGTAIFTVAYDINDAAGRALLSDCATNAAMFFDARTDEQLADSFEEITRGFRTVRVSE